MENKRGTNAVVNLSKLLWLDDDVIDRQALPECFGDRYLCGHNSLFARIRSLFFSSGYRYSCESTQSWYDYSAMSFLMLQDIFDSRVVPFTNTTATVRRVVARNPLLEMSANLFLTICKHNPTLHESAHCIAHCTLAPSFNVLGPSSRKSSYVLLSVLTEAYANTVERMAAALATTEPLRIFYMMNSFVECYEGTHEALREAVHLFGWIQTFNVGMLVFFFLNTHAEEIDGDIANTIIRIAFDRRPRADAELAFLKILVRQGFGLNRQFRTGTTPLYFRYLECEREFEELCRQPFDDSFLASSGVLDGISKLANLTCTQVLSEALLVSSASAPALGDPEWTPMTP